MKYYFSSGTNETGEWMEKRNYKRVTIKEIIFKSFSLRYNVLEKERWGWGKSLYNLWTSERKDNFILVVIVCGSSSNSIVQEVGSMILLWLTLHCAWEEQSHLPWGTPALGLRNQGTSVTTINSNNNNWWHILSVYYVPDSILRHPHMWTHLILTTPWGR